MSIIRQVRNAAAEYLNSGGVPGKRTSIHSDTLVSLHELAEEAFCIACETPRSGICLENVDSASRNALRERLLLCASDIGYAVETVDSIWQIELPNQSRIRVCAST